MEAKTVAQVKYISFLTRSDKRKDRVEIAAENLHLAALEAEEYSKKMGQEMMVTGWVKLQFWCECVRVLLN